MIDPNDLTGLRSTVLLAGGLQLVEDAQEVARSTSDVEDMGGLSDEVLEVLCSFSLAKRGVSGSLSVESVAREKAGGTYVPVGCEQEQGQPAGLDKQTDRQRTCEVLKSSLRGLSVCRERKE